MWSFFFSNFFLFPSLSFPSGYSRRRATDCEWIYISECVKQSHICRLTHVDDIRQPMLVSKCPPSGTSGDSILCLHHDNHPSFGGGFFCECACVRGCVFVCCTLLDPKSSFGMSIFGASSTFFRWTPDFTGDRASAGGPYLTSLTSHLSSAAAATHVLSPVWTLP